MCGKWLCESMPQTNLTLSVAYCHSTGQWHVEACSHSLLTEGEYRTHGAISRTLGPFDGAADALEWIVGEASAQIPLMALRDNVAPSQHPPQGTGAAPLD